MRKQTYKKFESILNYPWFKSCGKPGLASSSVTIISDWKAAAREANSSKWENCCLMAGNYLSYSTQITNWERANEWNDITDELRPMINTFVAKLLKKRELSVEFLEQIKDTLAWDIMSICLECEYEDTVAPIFYLPYLDPWYAGGHFPCGWTGDEFPSGWDGKLLDGKFIVY